MYIYEVGYYSYEDNSFHYLEHKTNFSEIEFNEILCNCYIEAYFNYKDSDEYKLSDSDNVDEYNNILICYDELLTDVIEILIKKYSFQVIQPKLSFNVFGWASINGNRFNSECNEHNKLIKLKLKNYGK